MQKHSVLLASTNRHLVRHVKRSLASAGYAVDPCAMDRAALTAKVGALDGVCIIDADEDPAEIRWLLQHLRVRRAEVSPLVLSHDRDNSFIPDLLLNEQLNNLVARHGAVATTSELVDEGELIVTCRKLMEKDIFGLEKYLSTWAIQIHGRDVHSTDEKQQSLAELESFLDRIDCYRGIRSSIVLAADELLMNAIFDAPRTMGGVAKYPDRHTRVDLEPNETVQLRYACDGRNVVVSVRDPFGTLDREVIVRYLRHCFGEQPAPIEHKDGGAGLGLYMVFNSITQLTFNIQSGRSTEAIAAFYVRSGARAFRRSSRSLNFFILTNNPEG